MKRYWFGVIAGVMVVGSNARAAGPTEKDCVAAGKSAEELRAAGDLVGTRARLTTCASVGCSRRLREECASQLGAIEAAMPAVVLEAKDGGSNNLTAVRVTMDGAPVLERPDGTAIPVNPGEHRVAFDAAGFRRTESTFVAREGQKKLRIVVYLDPAGTPAPAPLLVSPADGASGRRDEPGTLLGRRRKIGLALGAAGVGGLAVGTIWSILSKVTYDHALGSECGGDVSHCSPQGIAHGQTAHTQATVATVGFVAAGAFLAAGAVLYFTGPRETSLALAPTVGGSEGVTVVGRW